MHLHDEHLLQFISDAGLVPRAALEEAQADAKRSGGGLADALLARGVLSEDDLRRASAYLLGIPIVSVDTRALELEVLSHIPEPLARAHGAVALRREGDQLEVALLSLDAIDALSKIASERGFRLVPRLTSTASMRAALRRYQELLGATYGDVVARGAREGATRSEVNAAVDALLAHASSMRANAVHVEPGAETRIRYRIRDGLAEAMVLPASAARALIARLRALARTDTPFGEGRFRAELGGETVSVRCATVPTVAGEKATLSLSYAPSSGYSLPALGLRGDALEALEHALRTPAGLILVSGPTGSGKTTTLYTMLDLLASSGVSAATIEERIGRRLPFAHQVAVHPEGGFSLAAGLRALLRQDPDVVLVDGVRDAETALLCATAARSRHTVLASMEATSAAEAAALLAERVGDPAVVASSLEVSVATRRVPLLAPDATETHVLTPEDVATLEQRLDLNRVLTMLKREGHVGEDVGWYEIPFRRPRPGVRPEEAYRGTTGVYEVLPVSRRIRTLLEDGAPAEELARVGAHEGMLTLREDALYAAALGRTSLEEALRVA